MDVHFLPERLTGNINVSGDAIDGDAKLLKAESPVPEAAAEYSSRVGRAKHMHMHMHMRMHAVALCNTKMMHVVCSLSALCLSNSSGP